MAPRRGIGSDDVGASGGLFGHLPRSWSLALGIGAASCSAAHAGAPSAPPAPVTATTTPVTATAAPAPVTATAAPTPVTASEATAAVPVTTAKYAAHAAPLSRDHDYFKSAPAPDFWALIPYYVGQQDDVSCSLASLAMLVNSARHAWALGSEQPLVTQPLLRERVRSRAWDEGLAPGGEGVTLDQVAELATQSLRAFGITTARVEVTHVPDRSPLTLARLRERLELSESSASDWLLLNFFAESYVGTGDYGHIAPVGAYDASSKRVLVLDPDRGWYEPYWIPDEVALAGMATPDSVTGKPRGYVYVSLCGTAGCAP